MYDWLISSELWPSLEVRLLFQFFYDGLWFTKIQMNEAYLVITVRYT